jgi:hypothetical protein
MDDRRSGAVVSDSLTAEHELQWPWMQRPFGPSAKIAGLDRIWASIHNLLDR